MRSIVIISLFILLITIFSMLPVDGAPTTLKTNSHSSAASAKATTPSSHSTQAKNSGTPKTSGTTRSKATATNNAKQKTTSKTAKSSTSKPSTAKGTTKAAKPKSQGNRKKRLSQWEWE